MSSKSSEKVSTNATSVALDRKVTLDEGTAIVDSIVQSNDPEVVSAALAPMLAAWNSMASSNNINLSEITGYGSSILDMLDKSQITMSASAAGMLREGVTMFEELMTQNKLNVELVEMTADRSFDLADNSLDIIADIKTADFSELSKTIMVFAVGMLIVSGWILKGK